MMHCPLAGGYDHICKLWDVRAPSAAVLSLDHGAPIEDVTFFPSGGGRLPAHAACTGCLLGLTQLVLVHSSFNTRTASRGCLLMACLQGVRFIFGGLLPHARWWVRVLHQSMCPCEANTHSCPPCSHQNLPTLLQRPAPPPHPPTCTHTHH